MEMKQWSLGPLLPTQTVTLVDSTLRNTKSITKGRPYCRGSGLRSEQPPTAPPILAFPLGPRSARVITSEAEAAIEVTTHVSDLCEDAGTVLQKLDPTMRGRIQVDIQDIQGV